MNRIRNYENSDDENILHLLSDLKISPDSGYSLFGSREKLFLQTSVLISDEKFSGFGSIWKKELHNKPLYISTYALESANCLENLEILYKEFENIRNKSFQGSKFQTAYPSHLKKHLDFYLAKNFKKVLETYSKTIPISDLNLNIHFQNPENINIETLQNLPFLENHKNTILDLLIKNYSFHHAHNFPKQESKKFWNDFYLENDVLLEHSYLLMSSDKITGILLSRKINEGNIFFEIVLVDVGKEKIELVTNLLLLIFLERIKKENHFKKIEFELDDNNLGNLEIIKQLKLDSIFNNSDRIITLQE